MSALCVSIKTAAARLNISEDLARRMAAEGRIPTLRFGRRVLVPVRALERLCRSLPPAAGGREG